MGCGCASYSVNANTIGLVSRGTSDVFRSSATSRAAGFRAVSIPVNRSYSAFARNPHGVGLKSRSNQADSFLASAAFAPSGYCRYQVIQPLAAPTLCRTIASCISAVSSWRSEANVNSSTMTGFTPPPQARRVITSVSRAAFTRGFSSLNVSVS